MGRPASSSGLGCRASSAARSAPGLGGLLPGGDRFRIYTITDSFPEIARSAYRLQVTGLVDKPLELTLDDLEAMPRTKLVKDFQCVTGWRVPQVHWEGVRLSDVLDEAGVHDGAGGLDFDSYDGADTESLTLDQARRPDVIVAYRMLGAPVTTEHGGPVRLYVAPMYGYKSLKWLSAIRVVDRAVPGLLGAERLLAVDALDRQFERSVPTSPLTIGQRPSAGPGSRPTPIGGPSPPPLRPRRAGRPLGQRRCSSASSWPPPFRSTSSRSRASSDAGLSSPTSTRGAASLSPCP